MDLIAVIMAAPDTKVRFLEASKLLNYGFANYSIYTDQNLDTPIEPVRVVKGVTDTVTGKVQKEFSYLCSKGRSQENIRKEIVLEEQIPAPVALETKIGEIVYYYGDEKIGSVDIVAAESIAKAGFKDYFIKVLKRYFMTNEKPKAVNPKAS